MFNCCSNRFLVSDVFLEFLFLHELASEDLCTFFVNSFFVIYPVVNPKIACLYDVFPFQIDK